MARVVSWNFRIGGVDYFSYLTGPTIGDNNPRIEESALDQIEANSIGYKTLKLSPSEYRQAFEDMKNAIVNRFGESVPFEDADKYLNVTKNSDNEEAEVLMLVGADGRNIAENLIPSFTFHTSNQAIAIGTGDDYKLDVKATIELEAFFEWNGYRYPCDEVIVSGKDALNNEVFTCETSDMQTYTNIKLSIAKDTKFPDNDPHFIECEIIGVKGGKNYKATFTVSAVLGGKEGVSYDLLVTPKQFQYDSPNDISSSDRVSVTVLKNGKRLSNSELSTENLKICYEFNSNGNRPDPFTYDNEDMHDFDQAESISGGYGYCLTASKIDQYGGSVTFYLVETVGTLSVVDSDSASIVVNGRDSSFIRVELDNEVEAIGVGDDYVLDLNDGVYVTASTSVRMYSGDTSLKITDIRTSGTSVNDDHWHDAHVPHAGTDSMDRPYGLIRIILENGFTFGDDYRDKITLTIKGVDPSSGSMTAETTCAFTIVAIRGGKDGVIFRLTPSCDYIMYDPNAGLIQCEASEPFPVSELGGKTISAVATQGNYYKNPSEIAADNERVTYSIGVTHSSAQMAYGASTPGIDGRNFTAPLSEVMGDMSNPTSRYITFYWTKQIGSEVYLIDRETVPVISAGLDGRFAKIELSNEVDAITIGDDTKLDIGDLDVVEVGTSIRAVGSELTDLDITAVRADVIQDFDGWHSDSEGWPAVQLEVSDNNGTSWSPVDGQPHKKWRFWYNLPNGFDFGEDKKEKIKLDVTYRLEDETEHTGTAIFTIVGVPGGKEGQRYQLVPEVDIVRYFANDDVFDEETLICDATIGLERLETGHIYYGERVKTEQGYRVLDIISPTFKNEYVESNSVQVRDMYFGQNPNFSGPTNQIAWYLTIDTDEGELIVDHETVSIVADGKDGDPNIKVELSNEIESIATGTDTSLGDMQNNEYVTARTDVYIVRGSSEKIEVCGFSSQWLDTVESNWLKNAPKLYKRSAKFYDDGHNEVEKREDGKWYYKGTNNEVPSSTSIHEELAPGDGGEISPSNRGKYTTLEVILNRNFDFGADMRKRLILILSYKDAITEEVKTVRGLFTLIAVKGGKDGMVFKIQPTPDFIGFDLQTGEWAGGTSQVSAYAFLNGNRLSQTQKPGTNENYREGRDYEVKITRGVVYDLDSAAQQWNTGVFSNYTEGSGVGFGDASPTAREQSIVFYLKFGDRVVDRESVPLYINGKEGKDGASSIIFDLSNENWVVTTGEDTKLDIANQITGGTYVTCSSGNTYAAIHIQTGSTDSNVPSSTCVVSIENNDTPNPFIRVTLKKNFEFGSAQKKSISITATTMLDGFTGSPVFNMCCVKNGHNGDEGVSYQLKTNAGSIVYDTNNKRYTPTRFEAMLYEGMERVQANYTLKVFDSEGQQVGSTQTASNANSISIPDVRNFVGFPTVGQIRVSANTSNDGWDSSDIPIVCSGKDGSGIVFDLTNDRDTIALGGDLILDTDVDLGDTAIGTMWQGSTQLAITNCSASVMNFDQRNLVHVTASVVGGNSVVLNVSLDSGLNFGALEEEGHQISVMVTATGTSVDGEDVVKDVKYTIHGFQGGQDGHVYRIVPSCSVIKYNGEDNRYVPDTVSAIFTDNGVPYSDFYMEYSADFDDPSQIHTEEYVEGTTLSVTNLIDQIGLNNFLVFRVYDRRGGNLLDREAVPVVYDGHDGLGGVEAVTDPKFINVNVDEQNKVKSAHEYNIRVGLMSGDTVVPCTITNTTITGFSAGQVTTSVNGSDSENYQKVKIIVPSDTNLGSDGTAYITFTCRATSNTNQVRSVSFYFYAAAGGRGARGPLTRIRDYSTEDDYQSGAENETYWDFIYYSTDDFEGGFFGCKVSQSHPATPPKVKTVDGVKVWDDTDANWEYYPTADFIASKVASFGRWPNGWVIDEGKIQHTTSSITLDADGAIIVKEPSWTAHKYTSGGYDIYVADMNYENGESVIAYSGGTLTGGLYKNYQVVSDGDYTYENNGNQIRVTIDAKTPVACYINMEGGIFQSASKDVVKLERPVSEDLYLLIKFRVDPSAGSTSYFICNYIYKIPAGTISGTLVSANSDAGSVTYGGGTTRMGIIYPRYCEATNLDGEITDDSIVPVCSLRSIRPGSPSTAAADFDDEICNDCGVDCSCYGTGVYADASCPSYGTCTSNCVDVVCSSDQNLNGNGTTVITYIETVQNIRFVSGTGDTDGTGNVLVTSTTTEAIYFSASMSNYYGTIANGTPEVGGTTRTYTRQSGTVRLDCDPNALSQIKISSVPHGDFVNPVITIGSGATKFFADGRLETTSGKFTGSIYAEDGVFNGSAYINEGTLNNVKVNGDISLNGNNYFKMYDSDGKERVEISNQTISPGDMINATSQDKFSVYTSFTRTDKSWINGKTYMTEPVELMATYISDADTLSIPVIKVSYSFSHTKSNRSITVAMYLENPGEGVTGLYSGNVSAKTATNESGTFSTTSRTFTNKAGHYRIKIQISGKFNKKLFGKTASLTVNVSSTSPVTVTHVTSAGSNVQHDYFDKFMVGTNGFSYVTDTGGMLVVCHESATNTSIKIQARKNGNGIYIDNDEFLFKANNKTYNMSKLLGLIENFDTSIIV